MHDSSLLALLEAVGLFDWKWPPFAADLRLEMYQDKAGEHWVRILYLGQVSSCCPVVFCFVSRWCCTCVYSFLFMEG